jgi:bifunctional non-homologous end joining protein LigD
MPLEEYGRKRDFARTPEPGPAPSPSAGGLYIIQRHAARALHHDLRLELDGVLLSWAVPKGPSLDPHDKRLAVHVEDHPVSYGTFEGTIPAGEYGGGTVMLWDRGTWEPLGDPHSMLAAGDLKFRLHGERLTGTWVLVRLRPREGDCSENWLLIKERDDVAAPGDGGAVLARFDTSVSTGRTMEQIAAGAEPAATAEPAAAPAPAAATPSADSAATPPGRRAALPRFVEPELATLVERAPDPPGWVHEIKLDGYRAQLRKDGERVTALTRSGKDWTDRWRPVADAVAALPASRLMLDGEVVVLDAAGRPSFQALQDELAAGRGERLVYHVFDLLHLDGRDLTALPLVERKRLLRVLLAGAETGALAGAGRGVLRYTEDLAERGGDVWEIACSLGLEGIVSKRADSPYRPGARTRDWVKSKCMQRQEFVVGGWTDPAGSRPGFGALLLGVNTDAGLTFMGRVGSGFPERRIADLAGRLSSLAADAVPFAKDPGRAAGRGIHWVRPEMVVEVSYLGITTEGLLRHPSFVGVRDDKQAKDVRLEKAVPDGDGAPATNVAASASRAPAPRASSPGSVLGIAISNPDKPMWPDAGVTKLDLARYFERVADRMMPYVVDRPLALVRCPEGATATSPGCFFQKHAEDGFFGPYRRQTITGSGGPAAYLAVSEPASLAGLAQMGVLEIHIWGSRMPDVEKPDMLVFDLDPGPGVGWRALGEGAGLVREILRLVGLESFVKTTGGKGLHVVAPIAPRQEWPEVSAFARAVAETAARSDPARYTSVAAKGRRGGRIFVDYLRNSRGATSVAPFSTRARAGAPVSVPLRWEELPRLGGSDAYSVANVPRRLAGLRDEPWAGFFDIQQAITPKARKTLGIG